MQVLRQLVTPERQQRSKQPRARLHSRQPSRPRSPERSHQHGLGLIVRVVRGHDEPGAGTASDPPKRRIPVLPGYRLGRLGAKEEAFDFEPNPIPFCGSPNALRHLPAGGPDAVVHVGGNEVEPMLVRARNEQIEERERVGTPRHGHERRPGGRRELGEMAAKSLDQGHTAT